LEWNAQFLSSDPLNGKAFQRAGAKLGIRIGLFGDEENALRWLGAYMVDDVN